MLLVGGRQVIDGNLTLGELHRLLHLRDDADGADADAGDGAWAWPSAAVASGNRLFEILDREPRIESPPGAPPLPDGGGRVELRGVTPALRRGRAAHPT